jgi:crotonobetainyl-CoA:carnitine CoA-transferase CaiB-like acyl-CoA transferase
VGASAVIAALLERETSGQGQVVELAMYDVATWLTSSAWPHLATGTPTVTGNRGREGQWQDVFAVLDGYVVIAAHATTHRQSLAKLVAAAEKPDATPGLDDDTLRSQVASWCGARPARDIVAQCQAAGVPAAAVLDLDAVAAHPQFRSRGTFVDMPTASGALAPTFGSVLRLSKTPGVPQAFAEPVGASTQAILADVRQRVAARKLRTNTPGL